MIALLPALLVAAQTAMAAEGLPTTPAQAAAEIVIYSDFQCPFCRRFASPTREMRVNGLNGRPVTITFKHFPLPFHLNAPLAHQAVEAARAQGKFWEMHDLLFANQARLGRADLLGYARTLGLDLPRFEKDLDSEATKSAVAADVAEGQRAGITATPSYFINGRLFEGTKTVTQLASLFQLSSADLAQARSKDRALQPGSRIADPGSRPTDPGARTPDPAPRIPARAIRTDSEITDTMLSLGPSNAPVTIEVFIDLQSSLSGAALEAVESVQRRFPGAVRVQFRSYPLAFHSQAVLAHEGAMIAARAGKFWEFTRALLTQQRSIREDAVVAIARSVGMNETEFRDDLRRHRYATRIEADLDDATRQGVRGSPAFVVNDRRIDGVPTLRALSANVAEALQEVRGTRAARN